MKRENQFLGKVFIFGNYSEKTLELVGSMKPMHSYSFILDERIQIVVFQGFLNDEKLGICPKPMFFLKVPTDFYYKTSRQYLMNLPSDEVLTKRKILIFKKIIHQFHDNKFLGIEDVFGFHTLNATYLKLSSSQERDTLNYIKNFSPSDDFVERYFPSFAQKLEELKKTSPNFVNWLDIQIVGNTKDIIFVARVFDACKKPFSRA